MILEQYPKDGRKEPHLQRLNFSNLFTIFFLTRCIQIELNNQTQKALNYRQRVIPGKSVKSIPVAHLNTMSMPNK